MNRSRETGALHTPGAMRQGRKERGQSRAGAQSSFALGATATPLTGGRAMQSPENDTTVSRPSHSPALRTVCAGGDGGNGASMESPENDGAVSRPSHRRLQNADGTGVSHIPTVTDCCCGVSSLSSSSRSKAKSKSFAVQTFRARCEEQRSEQRAPASLLFTREFHGGARGRASHEVET